MKGTGALADLEWPNGQVITGLVLTPDGAADPIPLAELLTYRVGMIFLTQEVDAGNAGFFDFESE